MARPTEHTYEVTVEWTGNLGPGTSDYRSYTRDHIIGTKGKPDIPGSSDPAFRGDSTRWNPEDLLVAAVSACHKLWYLHLCAVNGITVLAYRDLAKGTMVEGATMGDGRFSEVVLRPRVMIKAGNDASVAERLHAEAHGCCYVANSVNFPVRHEPVIIVEPSG